MVKMLSKNYSTLAILMAANVVDGGKKFEEVPASISTEVGELISPIELKSFGLTLDSSKTNIFLPHSTQYLFEKCLIPSRCQMCLILYQDKLLNHLI